MIGIGCLSACGSLKSEETKESETIKVVATFYPMYDFAKNIVGDEGEVSLLIEAGIEPHEYDPTAKDLVKMSQADVLVYNSEYMETWIPSVENSLEGSKVQLVKATKNLVLLPSEEAHESQEEHHHDYDPHLWLSPYRAKMLVEKITEQLSELFPNKADKFKVNAKRYLEELTTLDQEYFAALSVAKQKNFVTQHTAFNYLAVDYGLNQIGIAGISPEIEPSPARLAELTTYIKDNGIKYIYFEENVSEKIAKTLAEETGVQLEVLNPLESLTTQEINNGSNYQSVMKENLLALLKTTEVEGKEIYEQIKEPKTVSKGYFEDQDVKDRALSDYAGEWQSVYPYLLDGTLDSVFDYQAKLSKLKTADEYKNDYTIGYKTDVKKIIIDPQSIEFIKENGEVFKGDYRYTGYKVLQYKKGNRGVRYLFEAVNSEDGIPRYVQLSDHHIAPVKTKHFHIFTGNDSQEKLFDEMENWPTYYPNDLEGWQIAQEMLIH